MLISWNEGMNSLRLQKAWSLPNLDHLLEDEALAKVADPKAPRKVLGRSTLKLMS